MSSLQWDYQVVKGNNIKDLEEKVKFLLPLYYEVCGGVAFINNFILKR